MSAVIKNVNKESWKILRAEAIKHGVTTGKMLEVLVKEHVEKEKSKKHAWDLILTKRPLLTKKEAEAIKKRTEEFRKSFKMRI
ncbi:MAG: hypothetical protein HYU56_03640 [Candidatus Aenigmarchaeota archaeon]|nr:hypothetical protein [Candidatus Aenigmarchaeota archaeon]